jgi:gamma-D-glutamyl-L-lysine dipeptidyl-peptidase
MFSFLFLIQTVLVPVVTMRESPDESAKVVSQAIYAEQVSLLDTADDWIEVKTNLDGYTGWVEKSVVGDVMPVSASTIIATVQRNSAHVYAEQDTELGPILTLPYEARMIVVKAPLSGDRWYQVKLLDGTIAYIQSGDVSLMVKTLKREEIVAFAKQFLGLPYTWGGRSSFGYDCSGFVQMLYRRMGVFLPRDSKDQANWSGFKEIDIEALTPGDLIFWGKSAEKINHVGMYIGDGNFIHTVASVENMPYLRISNLSDAAWNGSATNYHCYRTARALK